MKHRVVIEPFFCERKLTLVLFSIEYIIIIIIFIAKQWHYGRRRYVFLYPIFSMFIIFFRNEKLYTIGVYLRTYLYTIIIKNAIVWFTQYHV